MIYFIQRGSDGPVKVGRAFDVKRRLRALQTSSPEPLRLLLAISGGAAREAEIHAALAASHLSGEWYRPTPQLFHLIENVREPEFEVHGARAIAVLRRTDSSSPTRPCPFCGEPHVHGAEDGHRVVHCTEVTRQELVTPGGVTLRQRDGYIVRSISGTGTG